MEWLDVIDEVTGAGNRTRACLLLHANREDRRVAALPSLTFLACDYLRRRMDAPRTAPGMRRGARQVCDRCGGALLLLLKEVICAGGGGGLRAGGTRQRRARGADPGPGSLTRDAARCSSSSGNYTHGSFPVTGFQDRGQ